MTMLEKAERALKEAFGGKEYMPYGEGVRAVLEAIREPDEAMRLASKRYKRAARVYSGPECYRRMIDAILEGESK